ncbi:hypothetical protein F4677DRAFT_440580 [Hypoxylon crocopeplum]|nr:hypothetical protein F4677DRAFT_440580 [Hypoxylon crocopeplum]
MAYLPSSQMDAVLKVLKSWQKGPATEYETSQIRRVIAEHIKETTPVPSTLVGKRWHNYPDCEADHHVFDDFSVMFPPTTIVSRLEPELSTLVSDYRRGKLSARKRISNYLDKHWRVNVTLIDVEWQAMMEPGDEPDMSHDPSDIAEQITGPSSKLNEPNRKSTYCILKHVANFFGKVSLSLLSLQNRLTIEMIVGDMANVLERTRYGLLDRPQQGQDKEGRESPALLDWPRKDYVGGSLTNFLYGAPVLKEGAGTGLTSCVLRNVPIWEGVDQFNAEHLLMYDRVMIQKHFQVKLANESQTARSFLFPMSFNMIMSEYHLWERCSTGRSSLEQLLPRASFSKWLFALFLKICLPFPRLQSDCTLVFAPHNMTVFLRLLVRMAELGYPGHWLSSIIASLGGGMITITARAPRKYVLDSAAVDEVHQSQTISVEPWAAEFTTLVTLWRGLLPFAAVVPSKILPSLEIINEYSVRIPFSPAGVLNVPHFMLVFWNHGKYGSPPENLRPLLLDDEKGHRERAARKIRSDGIKVLSTIKWVMKEKTATFWMRSDVMDLMLKEDWRVYIWRIDSWTRLSEGLALKDVPSRKRTWKECVMLT